MKLLTTCVQHPQDVVQGPASMAPFMEMSGVEVKLCMLLAAGFSCPTLFGPLRVGSCRVVSGHRIRRHGEPLTLRFQKARP